MRRMIERVFARYGTDATVQTGETLAQVKVFFQSVNSKSWQNMEAAFHPLGAVPGGQYVCMLPAAAAVEKGSTLTVAEKDYTVCRVETMPIDEAPVYQWAICTGKGSEEAWG